MASPYFTDPFNNYGMGASRAMIDEAYRMQMLQAMQSKHYEAEAKTISKIQPQKLQDELNPVLLLCEE